MERDQGRVNRKLLALKKKMEKHLGKAGHKCMHTTFLNMLKLVQQTLENIICNRMIYFPKNLKISLYTKCIEYQLLNRLICLQCCLEYPCLGHYKVIRCFRFNVYPFSHIFKKETRLESHK